MDGKINELFKISSINGFEFIYQNEDEKNYINIEYEPNKTIIVNIADLDDESLPNLIDSYIQELKQRFH